MDPRKRIGFRFVFFSMFISIKFETIRKKCFYCLIDISMTIIILHEANTFREVNINSKRRAEEENDYPS